MIQRCYDYEPSTKLLPLRLLPDSESPQEIVIIAFNDDCMCKVIDTQALLDDSYKQSEAVIPMAVWSIKILLVDGKRGKSNEPISFVKLLLDSNESNIKDQIHFFLYLASSRKSFFYSRTIIGKKILM